ncbi:MAG: autotransporter domain-containing protein [Proteobacteria bacterium]|nr:autotransporter domain-containing protein [Pseudomonadota bacterium]
MSKRSLMLSAAAVALLTTPALADTTLTTVSNTAHKTSTDGNLTINSGAGITLKTATNPLLTIDSSNTVNNGGTLLATDIGSVTAVQIDASGLTGSFLNNGSINLTGKGESKQAIYLTGSSSFTGNITLDSGSVVTVVGNSSHGIVADIGSTLNGDLLLGGTMSLSPTSAGSTAASGLSIASLAGTINGNVIIAAGSSYTATGMGAQGISVSGTIAGCNSAVVSGCTEIGTFSNSGVIAVAGAATRSSTSVNPESGSALIIGGSIAGGILNNGPGSSSDTTTSATIQANGSSTATLVIAPQLLSAITIGKDAADLVNPDYSFINRGVISASPLDPNLSSHAIVIAGTSSTVNTTFAGGFFNSGAIIASATNIDPGAAVTATALDIEDFVTLPSITVSGQSGSASLGIIAATVTGPEGGVANAISISGTSGTSVPTITIGPGGRVIATATATDPGKAGLTTLSAIAIRDVSNSLTTLTNAGTITATATTLTNGATSIAHAVDASLNTVALNFENTGSVTGDVLFGSGADTYYILGTNPTTSVATQKGDINFGYSTGGVDTLHVGQFANVAGSVTAQGDLDVLIDQNGTLTIQNAITTSGTNVQVRDLTVAAGSSSTAGTLNITVTQGDGSIPVIDVSRDATIGLGANLNVSYGSLISSSGTYTLIQTATGHLVIDSADVARYNAAIGGSNVPWLFNSAGVSYVADDGAGHSQLLLTVDPKSASQLNLTGYAKTLFPLANAAIAVDADLGAAMIAGVNSDADAQKAYDAFAPDVSGGTRAIAVSITDQGTGVVAARQRALRLFGKQPGDLTLWGNEFGQYISNQGGNVTQAGSTSAAEPGFKDHGFGFSLGIDEGSASNGWFGAAFTFYSGDVAEGGDRTSKSNSLWYLLSGYTDWRGKGLFVDTQVTVGYGNIKGKRQLILTLPASNTTFTREADSKRAALLGAIGLTVGANLRYGALAVIPQLSIDGMSLREEGYTETGGGNGFDLAVKPYYGNSLRVFFGSEFRTDLDVGDFYLQPSARLGYRFDLLNDPTKLHAQFADLNTSVSGNQPGTPFTLQGPDPSRGNAVAGFNLGATTENWTIGLSYDFVRGSHNETEQVGAITLLGRI